MFGNLIFKCRFLADKENASDEIYFARKTLGFAPPPKKKTQNFGKKRVKIEKRWRKEEKVDKNEEKTGKGIFPSIFKNFTGRGRRPPPQNGGGGGQGTPCNPPVVGLCPGKKYICSNLAFINLKTILAYVRMFILLLINHNSQPADYSLYVSQTACPIHCVYLTHSVKYDKSQMQYKYTMEIKNNTCKSTKKI